MAPSGNLLSICPFFIVKNLQDSIAYYRDRLGFTVNFQGPDALFEEFKEHGVQFVKELSFIDDGLWGFEIKDADEYVVAFFTLRS